MTSRFDFHYDDFTEQHYRRLMKRATDQYRLVPFTGFREDGRTCLWRHDIDYSPHRARRLAAIEAELGASATYFLDIHSEFCSVIGEVSSGIVREIIGMGHHVGLHFNAGFYDYRSWSPSDRLDILRREKAVLEAMFGVEVGCYSIHNPTTIEDWNSDDTVVAGMVNVYCREIREQYSYISDSNGLWSRGRLADVLEEPPPKLHVLTHAEWWTPDAMSPRERISRCIDGRAKALHQAYDQLLLEFMRPNVGAERPSAPAGRTTTDSR